MGQPMASATPRDASMPAATPRALPARQRPMASARNWSRISPSRAPTAMRSPISRVRSVTDTSMMFIIPTPPTTREMVAALAKERPGLAFDDRDGAGGDRRAHDVVEPGDALQLALRGRERHEDEVVLVRSLHGLSFGRQGAEHPE